ncbi:MAG: thioredoxin family protein [Lewinella sp.]|nr:thioredoxin family protein [Lewinella sp.]
MRHLTILLLLLIISAPAGAQGISFFHGTWEEALERARVEDKLIFVDAFAEWCGPCKRMAATVFPDAEVGAFYNPNFISLKIDMEKPENMEFRSKYPVAAFPTLFFINPDGEIVQRVKGALDVPGFISAGRAALANADPVEDYAAAYEEGDRSPELVYKYVRSLIRSGESHLRVANDYLREQGDLSTPENLRLILLSATEADSRIFNLMVDHRAEIVALESEDAFLSQVWSACHTTATKAIEFSSHDLLEEAWAKMKAHYPAKAELFALESEMDYAEAHYDSRAFVKAARDYTRCEAGEDAIAMRTLARRLADSFDDDERAMKLAVDAAIQATEISNGFREYYELAKIQLEAGNPDAALGAAQQALRRAETESPGSILAIQALIQQIQEG